MGKGFTLIELAVVIAIIAILAAVAVPRFSNLTDEAEVTAIKNFKSNLISAASIYATQTGKLPTTFDDFVTNGAVTPGGQQIITTAPIGHGNCNVSGATITCQPGDFPNLSAQSGITVTYTMTPQGDISVNLP